jgi:LCP family protein required for cell wall assembly
MFNSAFSEGWNAGGDYASAVACTMSTTQHNTGLVLDGFVLVDFAGFTTMVDALGGVPMCIPDKINAPEADLYLEPGEQVLDGHDALVTPELAKDSTTAQTPLASSASNNSSPPWRAKYCPATCSPTPRSSTDSRPPPHAR